MSHVDPNDSKQACPWCGAPTHGNADAACSHCGRSPAAPDPGARPERPPTGATEQAVSGVVQDSSLLCIGCGYNLSGTLLGGTCPECGRFVSESLGPHEVRVSGRAIGAVVLSSCALPAICGCAPLALPLAGAGIYMGIRTLRGTSVLPAAEMTLAIVAIVVGSIALPAALAMTVLYGVAIWAP